MTLLALSLFSSRDFKIAAANAKVIKKRRKDPLANISDVARIENVKKQSLIAYHAREKQKLEDRKTETEVRFMYCNVDRILNCF